MVERKPLPVPHPDEDQTGEEDDEEPVEWKLDDAYLRLRRVTL